MAHNILEVRAIAALNVDAWNRSVVSDVDVDNGNLVKLTGQSAVAGYGEVWTAVTPSTGNGLTGLWMAHEPEVVVTAGYKGLNPDIREFYNAIGKVFIAFKPQLGDIVVLTADGLAGTYIAGTTTHVNATDTTGGLKPVWGNSQTSSVFSMKLLKATYVSLASGALGSLGRVTAYKFEVVGL